MTNFNKNFNKAVDIRNFYRLADKYGFRNGNPFSYKRQECIIRQDANQGLCRGCS